MTTTPHLWQTEKHARHFIEGTRNAVPLAAEQISVMMTLIAKAKPKPVSILDLGCGDGILGRAALERFPGSHCLFADFSDTMIDAVTEKVVKEGDRASVAKADFSSPEWVAAAKTSAPFDVVLSGFAIHHQEDERKKAIYREIHDLLAPGGIFLNMEHVKSATAWGEELFVAEMRQGLYEYYQSINANKSFDDTVAELDARLHVNILATAEEQMNWLRDIGYQDVDCYFRIWELALIGGRKKA